MFYSAAAGDSCFPREFRAALSFLRWEAGLALAAAVTLFQLRAPETPVYTEQAPTVEGEG
jgi:hypothetical protein